MKAIWFVFWVIAYYGMVDYTTKNEFGFLERKTVREKIVVDTLSKSFCTLDSAVSFMERAEKYRPKDIMFIDTVWMKEFTMVHYLKKP